MAQEPVRADGHQSLGTVALLGLGFSILTALMLVVFVVQQRASGAFAAEFSTTQPAEAGYVVTGLMLADYLSAGLPEPIAFIADYATHFPKVVLGLQPPLYFTLEGMWFRLLGPSTPAVLLLPALLAALLVASAGWAGAGRLGVLPGVAIGAVLMALHPVREASAVVGLGLPLALLSLWAAFAWSAYLQSGRLRAALAFALLAAAAALTHLAGVALLLIPPLTVMLTGRLEPLRRRSFWLALLLALLLAAPWTLGTWPMVRASWPGPLGSSFAANARVQGAGLLAALGPVLAFLAVAGAGAALADPRREGRSPLLTVLLLQAVVLAAALCLLPAADTALLVAVLAPVVILAAAGGMGLLGLLSSGWRTLAGLAVMLVMLLAAMPALLQPVVKPANGMNAVAETFLADAGGPAAILVVADRQGEGALVAAVAQRDRDRRSFVVLARTALAVAGPGPATGAALYADPAQLMPALERLGTGYVALTATSEAPLHAEMEAVLAAFPERFKAIGRFKGADGAGETGLLAVLPPAAVAK